jgi:hypothetical protein
MGQGYFAFEAVNSSGPFSPGAAYLLSYGLPQFFFT